jgi:uncharacterized protein YcsI (UPF0317 family)
MSGMIFVIVPCLCNDVSGMSGVIYAHKNRTITQITADIPQTSLHKHGTITKIIPDIPQTALHKHGKIASIIPDISQTCQE